MADCDPPWEAGAGWSERGMTLARSHGGRRLAWALLTVADEEEKGVEETLHDIPPVQAGAGMEAAGVKAHRASTRVAREAARVADG